MDELVSWHRIFGLAWMDFFRGLPVTVDLEKDTSTQQQRLDLLILRKGPDPLAVQMPDGFEDLAAHNLVTFKSHRDALSGWSLNELLSHYVAYRKQASPSPDDLLPEDQFHLYAVCVRFPRDLAQRVDLERLRDGVYQAAHFTGVIRIIVVHELPREEHNAMLHLFSAREDMLRYAAEHFRPRSSETPSLLESLVNRYLGEGATMDALQELVQRTTKRVIKEATPRERVEGLSADELLTALDPAVREELLRRVRGDAGSPAPPATQEESPPPAAP